MTKDTTALAQDPSATLEKVREHLHRYEVVPHLSETRVVHIHDVYDDFPAIASLCIEQAEEIKRLQERLERADEALMSNAPICPKCGFQFSGKK